MSRQQKEGRRTSRNSAPNALQQNEALRDRDLSVWNLKASLEFGRLSRPRARGRDRGNRIALLLLFRCGFGFCTFDFKLAQSKIRNGDIPASRTSPGPRGESTRRNGCTTSDGGSPAL